MDKYRYSDTEMALLEGMDIPFGIYQFINKKVVCLVLSKGFMSLFGYSDREQAYWDMDNNMYKDTHADDAGRIADAAFRFAVDGGSYNVIYRSKNHKTGGYNIIHAHGKHFYTDTGVRLAQVWYTNEGSFSREDPLSDTLLTETLKNALYEESFIKSSYYDHLTGLPGMTYFFELATDKRQALKNEGCSPALMFTDFSGMKYYNHKFGFAEGDKLLRSFARLLAEHFGNENCSRLGQDHFAVITKKEGLEQELESLFAECSKLNDNRSLPLHAGIYLQWFDGIAASMACDRAKFACDTIKNVYSSEYSYYSLNMKNTEEKQQYIIANLNKAISEGWIKAYYQPIVRAVNERVCDEEALARWIDPAKGFMSPADFIPILEDHRLIYKLDLHIVDCVLKKIKTLKDAGLHLMPQSINLSRSDFDSCDIVEEIRRRVDDAGISHDLITIEITESVIGQDFEFMKKQIERFREHGFAVWMDDFGSGYSSLDVLQSIKFDLIKFDMRFMQKFNDGNNGRIILTEMLRMATSLGIETVCEGVETEEQKRFLQETGCSKLQGYYFEKPISVEGILEKYAQGRQIGFEDPEETKYFEAVGRVNLHDLSVIAQGEHNGLDNFFNIIPMAIIELRGWDVRFARSNQSYREFMNRYFNFSIDFTEGTFHDNRYAGESSFMRALLHCKQDDNTLFIDEHLPGNTTVHSCLRKIATNPVTGTVAIAVAVLSIMDGKQGTTYANIARALATDYFNLYYVNLETEKFIAYTSDAGNEELAIERHGENFFSESRKDALKMISSIYQDSFVKIFTKENVVDSLDKQGTFTYTYQLIIGGKPVYVNMKAVRMPYDPTHIIIGVSNIESQIKQRMLIENKWLNEVAYSRLTALSQDYLCMYTVDAETGDYYEYTADASYNKLGLDKKGKDFFTQAILDSESIIHSDDFAQFKQLFTKDNVMNDIRQNGIFTCAYRLTMQDKTIPVTLRAVIVSEEDGEKVIVGVMKAKV